MENAIGNHQSSTAAITNIAVQDHTRQWEAAAASSLNSPSLPHMRFHEAASGSRYKRFLWASLA